MKFRNFEKVEKVTNTFKMFNLYGILCFFDCVISQRSVSINVRCFFLQDYSFFNDLLLRVVKSGECGGQQEIYYLEFFI